MFGTRHKATQTHRVTFADEPNPHHPVPQKGNPIHPKGSKGQSVIDNINPTFLSEDQKRSMSDYHVHVRSVERMASARPEGPRFPNLQQMFNQKPVYGSPGEIVHEVPVMDEKKEKEKKTEKGKSGGEKEKKMENGKAVGEKEKNNGGKDGDRYEDVDGFAVDFLKKKHEFFEQQRLLSMQMRT